MITARTALLMALREGPGYGREFVRRIQRATAGRVRLAEGSIYPALHKLEAKRLARRWKVVPGRRRGDRARTYYELTERGVRVSEVYRADLLGLATAGQAPVPPSGENLERMRRRIELGAELSDAPPEFSIGKARAGRGRVA
jgi:DNA-binding PadR family transcriptional regulator